jgi:putative PEP-CTERM system TPR-repeat lipoprotein
MMSLLIRPGSIPAPFPLLVLLFLVIAASARADFEVFYESGIAYFSRGEYDAAAIDLKNALQENPRHLPSRLLLGRVNLLQGDPAGAEKELLQALRLGAAREKVYPSLGNAYLLQRKYEELLDTVVTRNSLTPEAETVYVFHGWAYLALGDLKAAWASFERAEGLSPENAEVSLGKARVLSARSEFEAAESIIDRALEQHGDNYEVWHQKGVLRASQGDEEQALKNFNRALELSPNNVKPLVSRGALYLRTNELDKARGDLAIVYEKRPNDFASGFMYARILSMQGDAETSREILVNLEELLTRIPEDVIKGEPSLLRTAAFLKFTRNELNLATLYASQYVRLKPDDLEMIKFLAKVRMANGQLRLAMEELYTAYQGHPNDPELLRLLGEGHLRRSQFAQAAILLERAAELAPDDAKIGTYLSLGKFGLGLEEEGQRELIKAFDQNTADSATAGVILARGQLRQGDDEAALATARKLISQQPRNPVLYNLLGAIHLDRGELDLARRAFTQTGRVRPGFLGGEYNLALLDMREGDTASARKRLLALLEANPQSVSVLLVLADLELMDNQPLRATSWLERAAALSLQDPQSGIRLVDLHIDNGKGSEALLVAEQLTQTFPKSGEARLALARAQLATHRAPEAVQTLRRAVSGADFEDARLLEIGAQQLELEDYEGARLTLHKASTGENRAKSLIGLVRIEMAGENFDAAKSMIDELAGDEASSTEAELLRGEMYLQQRRYAAAEKAYRASLETEPGTLAALGVFKSTFLQGRRDEAIDWLSGWIEEHPEDVVARRELARSQLSLGRQNEAKAILEQLVLSDFGDAYTLSSLARIYQLEGDPRANRMANMALQMAPDSAQVLDIFGWIQVTEGRPEEGISYLREAVSRGSDPIIRYHLAVALSELGRTDEAKSELESILRSRQEVPWLASAQELYDQL